MSCFVFRVNYGASFEFVRASLLEGKLRQGWGAEGMMAGQSEENFRRAWHRAWGENDASDAYIYGKWRMLGLISEIKEGDLIVVPKLSLLSAGVGRYFTILRRTASRTPSPLSAAISGMSYLSSRCAATAIRTTMTRGWSAAGSRLIRGR